MKKLRVFQKGKDIYEFVKKLEENEENIYLVFEKLYLFIKNDMNICENSQEFFKCYKLAVLWIKKVYSHINIESLFDAFFEIPLSIQIIIKIMHDLKSHLENYQLIDIIPNLFDKILKKETEINIMINNIELFKNFFGENYVEYKKIYNTFKIILQRIKKV